VVAPGQWGRERTEPYEEGGFQLVTCRHIGDTIYDFSLLGAKDAIMAFQPDWVYVQQEAASRLAREVLDWPGNFKRALFIWENLREPGPQEKMVLASYDLVVCGNEDAERLARKGGARKTIILPQVGVDEEHFQVRPVPREQRAIFVANEPPGSRRPEKGFDLAKRAWPTLGRLEFTPFKVMPWAYSQIQVVVCPSIDSSWWREQAAPYVSWEANSCLTPAIVTDAGSIPFWQERWAGRNPGVRIVPTGGLELRLVGKKLVMASQGQAQPEGLAIAFARQLAEAIGELLGDEALRQRMGREGREWVLTNASNPVIARRLMEALDA